MVDALATLVSMFKVSPHRDLPYIEFRCRGELAHCCLIEEDEDGMVLRYQMIHRRQGIPAWGL